MKDELFLADKEYDELPTAQLFVMLDNISKLIRGRALAALARRSKQDEGLVSHVLAAISNPENRDTRLMGTISVSHLGVACLFEFGSSKTRELVRQLLEDWPEPDRTDLLWFLKSQEISLDEGER